MLPGLSRNGPQVYYWEIRRTTHWFVAVDLLIFYIRMKDSLPILLKGSQLQRWWITRASIRGHGRTIYFAFT